MRKKLFIASAITALIFTLGCLVVYINITRIIDYNNVRNTKAAIRYRYYRAFNDLQEAQKILYKHQAGFESDVDGLVSAVESFDREISFIEGYLTETAKSKVCSQCHLSVNDIVRGAEDDLYKIMELVEEYKGELSEMLTSSDSRRRKELEYAVSRIGADIVTILEDSAAAMDRMVAQTETVNADLTARAKKIIVLCILILMATLLLVLAIAIPSVTRSVNTLIHGTEAIAAGDLSQRVEIKSKDEIGLLAQRFNHMAATLEEREIQFKELNLNLEKKVTERTLDLEKSYEKLRETAANLERANRELSELDRMKSDFIAIASHELRTPLVTISGYLDFLKDGVAGAMTPSQKDMIEVAWKSSRRLTKIIRDLLDLSRIEAGKLSLRREPFSIAQILVEAVADQKHFAELRNQKIVFQKSVALPVVSGDRNLLVHAFINLINNAIKFTPNNGVINVQVGRRAFEELAGNLERNKFFHEQVGSFLMEGDGFAEVVIADTGVGIPWEEQKRIFERFYEVGDVKTHSTGEYKFMGGGMGLGLSISKGFIEEHGGLIWVESEGKDLRSCPGSSFHILLPALAVEVAEEGENEVDAAAAKKEPETAATFRSAKPRILLIDDDRDILRFMEVLLRDKFEVTMAPCGEDGLRAAVTAKPDLILLDLLMYDLNGYEVTRALKGRQETQTIPIILFTAKAQKHEIDQGIEAGADDYLTKPFSNEDLFAKIEKFLKQGKPSTS